MFEKVAQKLADLGISYELVEHEPALTTEQADRFIEGIEKTLWNDKRNSRPKGLEFLDIERYSLALSPYFPKQNWLKSWVMSSSGAASPVISPRICQVRVRST